MFIEDILLATNPGYDGSSGEGKRKRRFVVLEMIYPCLSKNIRICCSWRPQSEGFCTARSLQAGERVNGKAGSYHPSHQCDKGHYPGRIFVPAGPKRGNKLWHWRKCLQPKCNPQNWDWCGVCPRTWNLLLWNRFSDIVFAMGQWEGDCWDGKIPLRFLKISPR